MAFVVAPRRPGTKPSLLASMPAELFGKFSTNGRGTPTPAEQGARNRKARDVLDAIPVAKPAKKRAAPKKTAKKKAKRK